MGINLIYGKNGSRSIKNGDVCNLTAFSMCAHNGTHVDAPYHFLDDGNTIDKVDLDRFIGYAYVARLTVFSVGLAVKYIILYRITTYKAPPTTDCVKYSLVLSLMILSFPIILYNSLMANSLTF